MHRSLKAAMLILILTIIYFALEFVLIQPQSWWTSYFYYVRPLMAMVLVTLLMRQPKTKRKISLRTQGDAKLYAFFAACAYLISFFMFGIIDGYAGNPYDTSIKGIMINLISLLPLYALFELLRNEILGRADKRYEVKLKYAVIVVFALAWLNWKAILAVDIHSTEALVKLIATTIIPEFVKQYYLCVLVTTAGVGWALMTQIAMTCGIFFFPVLPDLKWITEALLNNLFPLFSAVGLGNAVLIKENRGKRIAKEEGSLTTWLLTCMVSIAMVWFSVGIFPVYPTVVLTGSMEPVYYPGDMLMLKRTTIDQLRIGDVVQYQSGSISIIHRIIAIQGDGSLITQGDNNNAADIEPVKAEQIKGRVLSAVPKLGMPVLLMRAADKTELNEVKQNFEVGEEKK